MEVGNIGIALLAICAVIVIAMVLAGGFGSSV